MISRRVALAGTLALALAACGGRNEWTVSQDGGGNEGGPQPPAPCADGVTLRVAGIDPGNVTSVLLTVGSVSATYEAGGPIAVDHLAAGAVPVDAGAHDLAVLHFAGLTSPWGHGIVTLSFSQGVACACGSCQSLDMCTAPLVFRVDPGLVKPELCQAILRLDVARSVACGSDGPAFLPQFRVVYY